MRLPRRVTEPYVHGPSSTSVRYPYAAVFAFMFLLVAGWPFGASTQGVVTLGQVTFGTVTGGVRLSRTPSLDVVLAVKGALSSSDASDFRAWLLLADGRAGALSERQPKRGEAPLTIAGGGQSSVMLFRFEAAEPVAIVVGRGSQFAVYPVP